MIARCTHTHDAPAWTLGALDEAQAQQFAAHLQQCTLCQAEIEALTPAAEVLGMAAPQLAPPDALRDRIMGTVRAEADLLKAAGADADRPAAKAREGRGLFGRISPVLAAGVACVLLALGVVAGVVMDDGGSPGTRTETFSAKANEGMTALATVDSSDRVTLHLDGMEQPPDGRIYQVWLLRDGKVIPTSSLFVPSHGKATLTVDESLEGADHVMVSDEKMGGSEQPTGDVHVDAKLS